MFIGHYAVAFGAERHAASVSLGTLFLACELADQVWPNLVLTRLEFTSYPYSDSLLALILWSTRPQDRQGRVGLWLLLGFLILVFVANLLGALPPSAEAVAWSAQAMWLLVARGYWVDRHRIAVGQTARQATAGRRYRWGIFARMVKNPPAEGFALSDFDCAS